MQSHGQFAHGRWFGLETIRTLDPFPAGVSLSAQNPLSRRGIRPLARDLNTRSRWYRGQFFANLHLLCTSICRRISDAPRQMRSCAVSPTGHRGCEIRMSVDSAAAVIGSVFLVGGVDSACRLALRGATPATACIAVAQLVVAGGLIVQGFTVLTSAAFAIVAGLHSHAQARKVCAL